MTLRFFPLYVVADPVLVCTFSFLLSFLLLWYCSFFLFAVLAGLIGHHPSHRAYLIRDIDICIHSYVPIMNLFFSLSLSLSFASFVSRFFSLC